MKIIFLSTLLLVTFTVVNGSEGLHPSDLTSTTPRFTPVKYPGTYYKPYHRQEPLTTAPPQKSPPSEDEEQIDAAGKVPQKIQPSPQEDEEQIDAAGQVKPTEKSIKTTLQYPKPFVPVQPYSFAHGHAPVIEPTPPRPTIGIQTNRQGKLLVYQPKITTFRPFVSTTPWSQPQPQPTKSKHNTCEPPRYVLDFTWDSAAYRKRDSETFYTPLAYYQTLNSFHKSITGYNLRLDDGTGDICLTTVMNWKDLSAAVMTFQKYKENFNCHFIDGPKKFALECIPENMKGESFRAYFTKSDDKTYMVAYHCWESGNVEWFTYSNVKTLPNKLTQEILQHIEKLGFHPDEYKETDYNICYHEQPKPSVPATSDEPSEIGYGEGSTTGLFPECALPPSQFVNDFYFNSDLSELKRKEEFYIPLAGPKGYKLVRNLMTGSPLTDPLDSKFCPKYEFDWKNYDTRFVDAHDQLDRMERLKCKLIQDYRSHKEIYGMDCYHQSGESVFRLYVTLTNHKTYSLAKVCWKSGPATWFLYSNIKKIPERLKQKVLKHVHDLGFNEANYEENKYNTCEGDNDSLEDLLDEPEQDIESEIEEEGSATALFPKCVPPPSYLRRYTWESSSYRQGVEYLDVALAHTKAAEIYRKVLNEQAPSLECFRSRMNYGTNITKYIGLRGVASDEFTCTYATNQEWILQCLSKTKPWLSYRNYGIKSDNLSWILTYQCLNSGATPGSWTLWVTPGTMLSQDTKNQILRTVESLGFNPADYVEFSYEKCTYPDKSFAQRTCDCCTEANARYI